MEPLPISYQNNSFFSFFSIEHCIKEIQSEVNKQCPDVQLRTTTDCFELLDNYNPTKSPSIPHGDLIKFLKTLVKKNNNNFLFYTEVAWWTGIQFIQFLYVNIYFSEHVNLPYLGVVLLLCFYIPSGIQ